jgi:hypothetical protein
MKGKIYVDEDDFFITYKTTVSVVISFAFPSWIIKIMIFFKAGLVLL